MTLSLWQQMTGLQIGTNSSRGKLADIAYRMVSGATVPNIGTAGSAYDLTLLNSPTFTTVTYAGRSVNVWQGNGINKALQTSSTVPNIGAAPFVFSGVTARGTPALNIYPFLWSQRNTQAETTNMVYFGYNLNPVNASFCVLRKNTSADESSASLTGYPTDTNPVLFIGGIGTDRKAFICIGGICAVSTTPTASGFATTAKKLTIGGTVDLASQLMFDGKEGEMAWWKNVSGTAAELAAKAVIRNTDYLAGNISADNFDIWRGL